MSKMNAFLQGCCYIPPEDDSELSTPSFLGHLTRPVSSSSKSWHEITHYKKPLKLDDGVKSTKSEDVVYIKRYSVNEQSDSKSRKNCKCKIDRTKRFCSTGETLVVLPEETWMGQGSSRISTSRSTDASSYVSVYGPKSAHLPAHSRGRILDVISMCLWKCSIGCQQIPTINA